MTVRRTMAALAAGSLAATTMMSTLPASATTGTTTAVAPRVVSSAATGTVVTDFGLGASAFATRLQGTEVPADSGRTGWSYIGCTREAGLSRSNNLPEATPVDSSGNTIDVSTARSNVWTAKRNGVVSSNARSEVDRLNIANTTGSLRLTGLYSQTKTWHDATGFHQKAVAGFADFSAQSPVGTPFPVPSDPQPGEEVTIPGVATLKFFVSSSRQGKQVASATIDAVRIEVIDGSFLNIARSNSRIDGGVVTGPLGGYGLALDGTAVDGVARTGRLANEPMPCQGTDGQTKSNTVAGVTLTGLGQVDGLTGAVNGDQINNRNGYSSTRGRVEQINLGDGDLVVTGIVGSARVTLKDGQISKSTKGTTIGSITASGEGQAIPRPGESLEIPGVAIVTAGEPFRTPAGIGVTAVTIDVLPDTPGQSVIELGEAFAKLGRR